MYFISDLWDMIDIKDISGKILLSVSIGESCERVEELMKSDYLQLSWSSEKNDILPVGTYIEYKGEKFSLFEPYVPVQKDELEFTYTPQFQSRIMGWGKVPFFHYTETDGVISHREADWSLTDNPANFMAFVVKALRHETGEVWTYSVDSSLPASTTLSFQSVDLFSALNQIAEAFETEWWVDKAKKVIHLSKASHGTPVTLEVGKNISAPSVTSGKEGYYTRFYAFGSTRNILQDYQGANVNNLVNKRLTLDPSKYPGGYKDIRDGLRAEEIFSKVLIFDDIYPSSKLVISDVRSRLMYSIDEKGDKIQIGTKDGNPVYDQYAIWYFQIPGFTFNNSTYSKDNPEGMKIPDKNPSVNFQTGALAGREFELHYYDTDKKLVNSDGLTFQAKAGDFEIKFVKENSLTLPMMTGLVPTDGDNIILFNIKMPAEYTASAYIDLEAALDKEIDRLSSDFNNYQFNSNQVEFYHNNPGLSLGRNVTYKNKGYSYSTRVIKLVTKLDYEKDCNQIITVGNEKVKGSIQEIKEEVVSANKNIDLLASINNMTSALQQSYSRTQQLMMDGFASIKNMWKFDPNDPNVIYSPYQVYSQKGVSAYGQSGSGGSGGSGVSSLYMLDDVNPTVRDAAVGSILYKLTSDEWGAFNLTSALGTKVDKVAGKGLSSNDFSNAWLNKLKGIEEGANKYILKPATAALLGGIMVGSTLSVNAEGVLDYDLTKGKVEDVLTGNIASHHHDSFYYRKSDIDDLFEKVNIGTAASPVWAIRVNYRLFSVDGVSAYGRSSGGASGGLDEEQLWTILGNNGLEQIAKNHLTDALSEYATIQRLSNYATVNQLSNYATNTSVNNALAQKVTSTRKVSAGDGLAGGGSLTSDITLSLAPAGKSGTYYKVTTDGYGRVTSGVTTLSIGDISNLQTSLNNKLNKEDFYKLFTVNKKPDGSIESIQANYDFFSIKGVSAYGFSQVGSGGAGIDEDQLWSILGNSGTEQIAKSHLTTALSDYIDKTSSQDITGIKTFKNQIFIITSGLAPGISSTNGFMMNSMNYKDRPAFSMWPGGNRWLGMGIVGTDTIKFGATGSYHSEFGQGFKIKMLVNGTVESEGFIVSGRSGFLKANGKVDDNTYLTSHQAIYNLTFQAGRFTAKTFDPNGAAATVNVPTLTSHLTNDTGFLTSHQSLADYVTLNTEQDIIGTKTFKGGSYFDGETYFSGINHFGVGSSIVIDKEAPITLTNPSISFWNATTAASAKVGELSMDSTGKLIYTKSIKAPSFEGSLSGNASTATTAGKVANALSFAAGTFEAKSYNGSSAVTVNIPTHTTHLTNDSGFLTGITKSQVEDVLTGDITSHTHSYLPLTGGRVRGATTFGNYHENILIPLVVENTWNNKDTRGNGVGIYFKHSTSNETAKHWCLQSVSIGEYSNVTEFQLYSGWAKKVFLKVNSATGLIQATESSFAVSMIRDTSTAKHGLCFTNVAGDVVSYMGYHNTEKRLFLSAKNNSQWWVDEVGKYQLKIGVNSLTYNTYEIIHKGNIGSQSVNYANTAGGLKSFVTSSTASTYINQYTKIASIRLTAQYANGQGVIALYGTGDGMTSMGAGILSIRVKQQAALGSAPYVSLYYTPTATGYYTSANFKAVVVSNTTTETLVEFYLQNPISHNNMSMRMLAGEVVTLYSSQGYISSLPAGTVVGCMGSLDNYVDRVSNQQIDGQKRFNLPIMLNGLEIINSAAKIKAKSGAELYSDDNSASPTWYSNANFDTTRNVYAAKFITGGTSSQFLKANGDIDSTVYYHAGNSNNSKTNWNVLDLNVYGWVDFKLVNTGIKSSYTDAEFKATGDREVPSWTSNANIITERNIFAQDFDAKGDIYMGKALVATQNWVNDQGFLTSHQSLVNYVDRTSNQDINGIKTFKNQIKSTYNSGSWLNGVSNAALTCNFSGYGAIFNAPVNSGRISVSTYPNSTNLLYFGYASAAQISAGTNAFNTQMTWDAVTNTLTAGSFKRIGGAKNQFLKADGSVDDTAYLTQQSLADYVTLKTDQDISGIKTFLNNIVASSGIVTAPDSIAQFNGPAIFESGIDLRTPNTDIPFIRFVLSANSQSTPIGTLKLDANNVLSYSSDLNIDGELKATGLTVDTGSVGTYPSIMAGNGVMTNRYRNNYLSFSMYTNTQKWLGMGLVGTDTVKIGGSIAWNGVINQSVKLLVNGSVESGKFVVTNGTASQFLKANGSVDDTAYLPTTGGTLSGDLTVSNILHGSGAMNIGNPSNPNYVNFVEDTKFLKKAYLNGGVSIAGAVTMSSGDFTATTTNMKVKSLGTDYVLTNTPASTDVSRIHYGCQVTSGIRLGIGFYYSSSASIASIISGRSSGGSSNNFSSSYSTQWMHYGSIRATGTITPSSGSDRRLKTNIIPLERASNIIKTLRFYEYDYKKWALDNDPGLVRHSYGMIYDEVIGTRLSDMACMQENGYGALNYISSNYINIIAASVKETIYRTDILENRMSDAESRIQALEKENKELKEIVSRLKAA